jgi:kynureninase
LIRRKGDRIALALLPGVNYFTGQLFDMPRITAAAHSAGCTVGFDLAHAAGNIELRLHDWNIDFAAWCTYKYLNSGPGAVAGCFIHERHARNTDLKSLPRFGGWWGNDPATRFRMHLEPEFRPVPNADAWQLSNPPILSMAPVVASVEIFDHVGMKALREKSMLLTGYLQYLIDQFSDEAAGRRTRYTVVTPRDPEQRGCQLSILAHEHPRELHRELEAAGVVCDFREPNVVRVAPVPLYNTFHEVWRFAQILGRHG